MNPPDEAAALSALQHSFDVTALGSGDPVVGFNVLGAFACTLANLAPDDGSVTHKDGHVARLGTSLLVHGGGSAGQVVDEVISEVSKRQAKLMQLFQEYQKWRIENKGNPTINAMLPKNGSGDDAVNLFLNTLGADQRFAGQRDEHWKEAMENTHVEGDLHLAGRPKFLVSAGKPGDLREQLRGLRPGRPLVHLGFSKPEDLTNHSENVPALLDGRYSLGDGVVRGNIIVTDPMQVVARGLSDPDVSADWLEQLLWLTDGQAGPQPPGDETDRTSKSSAMIVPRFQEVLTSLMARRLAYIKDIPDEPLVLVAGVKPANVRWTAFLQQMEPSLPGISGSCRNLLTSLVFGLSEMAKFDSPLKFTLEGVEAFARFLVRRMANARMSILQAGEIARRQERVQFIFNKIRNGVTSERTISKNHKIPALERDVCLQWLVEADLIFRDAEGWMPREGARLDFNHCSLPLIEV